MNSPVYLDYNSTTPVDPRVLEVMLPFFSERFGNAASKTHAFGWTAAQAVDDAREQVAQLLNAETQEIYFTSGATESINLALKGAFDANKTRGRHIITIQTEHKAVLDTCRALEAEGAEVTYLPVDRQGVLDPAEVEKTIRPDTILVAVMLANNETGTIQPLRAIADIAHAHRAIVFSDTTQAFGKMNVDVHELGIDVCCVSAHKFYGPKGTGALFVRRKNPRVSLVPQLHGGGHERGLRPGTLNVAGIVGIGKAAELARAEWWSDAGRISILRTKLEQLLTELPGVFINGSIRDRLPNTTSLSVTGLKADGLIARLPLVAMATGSACTSALPEPSHVLKAMGLSDELAFGSIRISLGRMSKEEEVMEAGREIAVQIEKLR